MTDKKRRRRIFWASLALGTAGVALGLSVVLYRHPIAALEWYARRTLGLAGLRQRLVEHRRGVWSYFDRPGPDTGSPVTVVLVHGLGGQAGNWFKTVRSLRNYEVVVLDLPGHGDCTFEQLDWTSETVFELFVQLVDEATHDRPLVLVGNSMGGWLSLLYSLKFPHRVARLVLVNSAGLEFDYDRRLLMPRNRRDAQRTVDAVIGDDAPRLPGFMLDAMIQNAEGSPLANAVERVDDAPFVDDQLSDLKVPTEIIWGTADRLIPPSHAQKFYEAIPNARLHPMEGIGHSPQVSAPRHFNRLLEAIVDDAALQPLRPRQRT